MDSTTGPEPENTSAPDGIDRLEQTLRRLKEKQEAWRRLLESMEDMRTGTPEPPAPETPTT